MATTSVCKRHQIEEDRIDGNSSNNNICVSNNNNNSVSNNNNNSSGSSVSGGGVNSSGLSTAVLQQQQTRTNSNNNNSNNSTSSTGINNINSQEINNNNDSGGTPGVSRVLLLRNLSRGVTETDVTSFVSPFTRNVPPKIYLHPSGGNAFVEFVDAEAAAAAYEYFTAHPISLKGTTVRISFSKRQSVVTAMEQKLDPYKVILASVTNLLYPVDIDLMHFLFSKYGCIEKIVTFRKSPTMYQALIQFGVADEAKAAMSELHNRNIYDGCNTLQIQSSRLIELKVKGNCGTSWDYTKGLPPPGGCAAAEQSGLFNRYNRNNHMSGDNGGNGGAMGMGGMYGGGHSYGMPLINNRAPAGGVPPAHHHHPHAGGGQMHPGAGGGHLPPHLQNPNSVGPGQGNQGGGHMSSHQHMHGHNMSGGGGVNGVGGSGLAATVSPDKLPKELRDVNLETINTSNTPVIIVYNLPTEDIDVYKLFNLFSIYGSVKRVKIMREKRDAALIQYADPLYATVAFRLLQSAVVGESELQISFSKNHEVKLPTHSQEDEDVKRTMQFQPKDQRYAHEDVDKYMKGACKPTCTLFVANLADSVSEEELKSLFNRHGTVHRFTFRSPKVPNVSKTQMAILTMTNESETTTALMHLHNHELHSRSLKVAFSRSTLP